MSAPRALDPATVIGADLLARRQAASAAARAKQQLLAVAKALSDQEKAQVRLSPVGMLGLGLLASAGYLVWRRP